MTLTDWTVYDLTTQLPKRAGRKNSALLETIKYDAATEGLLLGSRAKLVEEQVVVPRNGASPYLRRRAEADIAAARYRAPVPTSEQVVVELMRTKLGVQVSPADLTAATEAARERLSG